MFARYPNMLHLSRLEIALKILTAAGFPVELEAKRAAFAYADELLALASVSNAPPPEPSPDDREAMRALTMFAGWANGHTMMNWRRLAESIGLKRRRMETARDRLIRDGRVVQRGRRFYVVGATGELAAES